MFQASRRRGTATSVAMATNGQHSAGPSLRERLEAALKDSEAHAPDSVRAATLRLINCAMRDRDMSARTHGRCSGCAETELREVLEMMASQREVSAAEYDESGRIEDAEREREELAVIREFLPRPLVGEALNEAVQTVVDDLNASKLTDLGRCMSALKERFPGRIEPGEAGRVVRDALR